MKLNDLLQQLNERTPEPFYKEDNDEVVEFNPPRIEKFEEINVFGYIVDVKVKMHSTEDLEIVELYFEEEDEDYTPDQLLTKLKKSSAELTKVEKQLFKILDKG